MQVVGLISTLIKGLLILTFVSIMQGCGGGGSGSDNTVVAVQSNTAPIANAGLDQTVSVGVVVALNANASSDPDGDSLAFTWTVSSSPEGSNVVLENLASANPTFTADQVGVYVISLTVNDGTQNSVIDEVIITASAVDVVDVNAAPIANAGVDQNVITGSEVFLDGIASADPEGDSISYRWDFISKPVGSVASLVNSANVSTNFAADLDGEYVISLIVNDGELESESDTISVTASTENMAPVANAGIDQNVESSSLVNLNGNGSSDANGDVLTYNWVIETAPATSSAALANNDSIAPSFTPVVDGDYIISLTVNDGIVNSTADSVIIAVSAVASACSQSDNFIDVADTANYLDYDGDGLTNNDHNPALDLTPELSVVCDNDLVTIKSNGLVNFDYVHIAPTGEPVVGGRAPSLTPEDHEWVIPRYPEIQAQPTNIPLLDVVAITVTGVQVFGPNETNPYLDPFSHGLTGYCNGHTTTYHFHARPDCLFSVPKLNSTETLFTGELPNLVLGYALDGFPIHDRWACDDIDCTSVSEVKSSWVYTGNNDFANEPAWDNYEYVESESPLDECNGMTLPDGSYAYFTTETFPYYVACYVGDWEPAPGQRLRPDTNQQQKSAVIETALFANTKQSEANEMDDKQDLEIALGFANKLAEKISLEEYQIASFVEIMKYYPAEKTSAFNLQKNGLNNAVDSFENETLEKLSTLLYAEQLDRLKLVMADQKLHKNAF